MTLTNKIRESITEAIDDTVVVSNLGACIMYKEPIVTSGSSLCKYVKDHLDDDDLLKFNAAIELECELKVVVYNTTDAVYITTTTNGADTFNRILH